MAYKCFILCIFALVFVGCIKDTDLDANLDRKVVVEFVLTDDNVQNMYLSLTKRPGEMSAPIINDADIKLTDVSRGVDLDKFRKVEKDRWALDYSGEPGHKYRLGVKIDGYETVWAEQEMPEKFELVQAGFSANGAYLPQYAGYGSFYSVDNIPEYLLVKGIRREKETGEYQPVKELCTDYPGLEDINSTGQFYDGNPKWRTGTGGWGGTPFVYHDAPTEGEDGVWTYMFPNLIGKELHNEFLLIHRVNENHAGLDKLYDFADGKGFCISGSFDITEVYYDDDTFLGWNEYLVYSSLSQDYGKFMKDIYQFKKAHEGDNLTAIYLRDNIHSNIQGGLGIFGTMVSNKVEFIGQSQIPSPR